MAIVKMKGLRLVAMQRDREDLLERLQRLGCVEVEEPTARDPGPQWEALSRPDGAGLARARECSTAVQRALAALRSYAPGKSTLLKGRPVLTQEAFFDDAGYTTALRVAEEINEAERHIKASTVQKSKLQSQKAALAPWLSLDVPLDVQPGKEFAVQMGTIPAAEAIQELEGALLAESELVELTEVSADRELRYCMLVYHISAEDGVSQVLRDHSWSRVNFREWTGPAVENDRWVDQEIRELDEGIQRCKEEIMDRAGEREHLQWALDRAGLEIQREEAKSRLLDTGSAFLLQGWFPAEKEEELKALLARYACAWESREPAPDDYPQVPVQLKNNWFTRPLNMVTEMYSLPAYGSLDPNPLMAPFFILFYGIMMADMGYGLLMTLGGLFILKKLKPKGTMSHFAGLLSLCGVSTFLMGALTGGFFGDFIPQLVKIIDPESTFALPALFTPLDDTLMILVGSMVLGCIQIVTGMAISFVKKLRDGKVMDAVWEEVTWWLVFLGAGLMAAGLTSLVLILGCVMVVAGPLVTGKGFGKVTGIFGSLYNHITGYFGDILSYSRLMALMLAGSVIAQVFNTLGAIPGNVVIFFIISMAGNALNFALNLLGCYVHDLRLQCLEYFGKFYEDGGKPFRPMAMNTKYVDITE